MVTCGSKPSEPVKTPPTVAEFCPGGAAPLFTATVTLFGCMDDLAAAASVLAIDVDSDAEEEQELGAAPDDSGDHVGPKSVLEPSPEDKENHPDVPAGGEAGAAHRKVSKPAPTMNRSLCAPPFT